MCVNEENETSNIWIVNEQECYKNDDYHGQQIQEFW